MKQKAFILLIFFLPLATIAQNKKPFPKDYFGSPIDMPTLLSASFGELRSNHFHTGIDFKTQGVTGKKLYAIADGYVSRIKISAWGYGYALYITHPNGYVSVYGHLERYNDKIASFVKDLQYKMQSFEMDYMLDSTLLKVKKGEVVAYSGNSGYSGGPHLHFEIRDAHTEQALNPLDFGIKTTDNIAPIIEAIKVYSFNRGFSYESDTSAEYSVYKEGAAYKIVDPETITVANNFALSINTYDKQNYTNNKYGVYAIELYIDEQLIYKHAIDGIYFHENRYINSFVDYRNYMLNKKRFQKSFIDPGNKLSIYHKNLNNGIISLNDTLEHSVTYKVFDYYSNFAQLNFKVKALQKPNNNRIDTKPDEELIWRYNKPNYYAVDGFLLYAPVGTIYTDIEFNCKIYKRIAESYSPVYSIMDILTPAHHYFSMSILYDTTLIINREKLYIAYKEGNKKWVYTGNEWNGNYLVAKVRDFGLYTIMADTVKPEIKPYNLKADGIIGKLSTIQFKTKDEGSGIKEYKATLNGKWLLMEYDGKKDLLTYYIDDKLENGNNTFELHVSDMLNNESVYNMTLKK